MKAKVRCGQIQDGADLHGSSRTLTHRKNPEGDRPYCLIGTNDSQTRKSKAVQVKAEGMHATIATA